MITQHTPTPWMVVEDSTIGENGSRIQDSQQQTIASTSYKSFGVNRANAALIVQAVNEHEALCYVAEAAEELMCDLMEADVNFKSQNKFYEALATLASTRAGRYK